jgi:hypothetical protein
MESILSEGMFKTLQIHFLTPKYSSHYIHNLVSGAQHQSLSNINKLQELNLVEEGNSSLGLKAEVSLPLM